MSTSKYYGRRRRSNPPLLPDGVDIIVESPPFSACSTIDKLLVYASSLIVVGSPIWFYGGIIYLYRKWRHYRALAAQAAATAVNDCNYTATSYETSSGESSQERSEKQQSHHQQQQQQQQQQQTNNSSDYENYQRLAKRYCTALITVIVLSIWGPHRSPKVGKLLGVRNWRLWDAWLNYIGYTVLHDRGGEQQQQPIMSPEEDNNTSPILAFVPHGIFPFALAFSCLPEQGYQDTWGVFRPVVATATKLFPLVRMFISWMGGIDASRDAVSSALTQSDTTIGIAPGGIAEMFETYPKPGLHRNDEAFRVRNGIFKLALKHQRPVIPIYCFGATKMLRRVQLPTFIENLSRVLKISLVLFFGKWNLPIPFRQRLMYVMGKTIYPPLDNIKHDDDTLFNQQAQDMHDRFCDEVMRIFERNREHYGWGNKTLRVV
ncbi:hypothetical protein ACHAWC_010346 [Mediolabrus comicus]